MNFDGSFHFECGSIYYSWTSEISPLQHNSVSLLDLLYNGKYQLNVNIWMWNENSDEAVRPWAVAKKRSPVCSDMKWIWSEAPDYKSVLHTQDWWNWTNVKGFQSTPTHTNFTLKHETSSINCHTLVLHDDKKKNTSAFYLLFVRTCEVLAASDCL